jgi:hypothetical protein
MLLSNGLCRIFIDIIFLRQLKAKKFHDVISFLQQPPSVSWKTTEVCKNAVNCPEGTDWKILKNVVQVEVVLAEAFQLRSLLSQHSYLNR